MGNVKLIDVYKPLLPYIKRATGRLSDGRSVAMWMSANSANDGGDGTNVAKIYIWISDDQLRTSFGALDTTKVIQTPIPIVKYTPPVAPCSSTIRGVASLTVGTDNKIYIAWAGVDGSLHCTSWQYTTGAGGAKGTVGVATDQVASATVAITNRFRQIDLDIAGAANPIIATYEAVNSTGTAGAFIRAYVRNNSGSWVRIQSVALNNGLSIYPGTEEVSVSWSANGTSSGVSRLLIYWESVGQFYDYGTGIQEWQYNVSTGTTDSAFTVGYWFSELPGGLHHDQGVGQRRGWIFKLNSGTQAMWLVAGVVGAALPKFWATKLTTNNYSPPIITSYQGSTIRLTSVDDRMIGSIDTSRDSRLAVGCQYADNRLLFGFVGYSRVRKGRLFREVMFRYNSITDWGYAFVDTIPRPADGVGPNDWDEIPVAIYGGDNSRTTVSPGQFNWICAYPIDPSIGYTTYGEIRNVAEEIPGAPRPLSPNFSTENTNRPNFKVAVDPGTSPPSHWAKVEVQVASNDTFTANVRSAIQPNKEFRYYGTIEESIAGESIVTVPGTLLNTPLFTGSWYWRARMVTDKNQAGPWAGGLLVQNFSVSHPPTALPITPKFDSIVDFGTGDITFTWQMNDPEPTDGQSAYNLVITRSDSGVVVLDTGWVASSQKTATVAISSSLKDIPLQWRIRLKDNDGAEGSFSNLVRFTVGTNPSVAVVSPANGTTAINPNVGFETNLSGWTPNSGTVVRDTAQFHSGVASSLMTATGGFSSQYLETDVFDAIQGLDYYANAWVRTPAAWAGGASIAFNWFTSSSVYISTTTAGSVANLNAATWTNIAGNAKPPEGASKVSMLVSHTGTPAAGAQFSIDDAQLGQNVITTAMPTFTWSFTGFGGRAQRAYRVVVTDIISGSVVGDSLWQMSAATSFSFIDQILVNEAAYNVTVYVQDSGGLQSSAAATFVTEWIHPTQPVTINLSQDGFKTTVSWSGGQDISFVAWRVWRRYRKPVLPEMDFDDSATAWELIAEFTDPSNTTFRDYQAPLNKPADYTVTQLADRFGSLIDSTITTYQTITCKSDRYYFVPEDLVGTIASYEASNVSADSFTGEVEQETVHVIGRGRQVQVGDDLGYNGTLTLRLRNPSTARADREFLEYLASSKTNNVYLRSPFGDVLLVKLGSLSFTRMAGVGATDGAGNIADLGDLTVPYSEVISNTVRITRLDI